MSRPIKNLIPPGGWNYIQGDVTLKAGTQDDLYKVVESYRAANGLPLGDVTGDVDQFICSNWPRNCHNVDSVSINSLSHQPPTASQQLLEDMATWATNLLQSSKPISYVSPETAEERARVCRACPMNANWRGSCADCVTSAERVLNSLRHGRDTQSSKVLGGCNQFRHDNRTAIFIDQEFLPKGNGAVRACWLNT